MGHICNKFLTRLLDQPKLCQHNIKCIGNILRLRAVVNIQISVQRTFCQITNILIHMFQRPYQPVCKKNGKCQRNHADHRYPDLRRTSESIQSGMNTVRRSTGKNHSGDLLIYIRSCHNGHRQFNKTSAHIMAGGVPFKSTLPLLPPQSYGLPPVHRCLLQY